MFSIPLYLTEQYRCSYLDDETAQTASVYPEFQLTVDLYSRLIKQGFRRSGNDVYKTHCPQCQQCIPVRIPIEYFRLNRSQKRCLKKNQLTQICIKPAVFDPAHYELYLRYQQRRHADSNMANSSADDYINFLASRWCNTLFVEILIDQKLAAVAIVDLLDNALSAVYTFFDPDLSHYSLGTYAVLWQIGYAKELRLNDVYLGFWIKECRKMRYKDQYNPLYGYIDQQWQKISL